MEPLFAGEIAYAVAGMSRKEVNDIVLRLLDRYESRLEDRPLGLRYQDVYDMATRRPKKDALEFYKQARKDLTDMGLEFKNDSPYL